MSNSVTPSGLSEAEAWDGELSPVVASWLRFVAGGLKGKLCLVGPEELGWEVGEEVAREKRLGQQQGAERLLHSMPLKDAGVIDWFREVGEWHREVGAGVWEGRPVGEPRSAGEIAGKLLAPYQVRQGTVRLAGCTFEERPSLCIVTAAANDDHLELNYWGPDGNRLSSGRIAQAGLDRFISVHGRLRASDRELVQQWLRVARDGRQEVIDVAVVWSAWVAGKIVLQFDAGPSAHLGFEGWGRDYLAGTAQAPPFRCRFSGLDSYAVVLLSDGTITVPEGVAICEETGAELLLSQMGHSDVSGRSVDRDLLAVCAVSGGHALRDEMVCCDWCGEQVLPGIIDKGVCRRCRDPETMIDRNEAWVDRFRRRHPQEAASLGRAAQWRGWRGTTRAFVRGAHWGRPVFYLVDMESGEILRRGQRDRFGARWQINSLSETD